MKSLRLRKPRNRNKGRRESVPVYVDGKYVRSVTKKQGSKEVAGKVLKPRSGHQRRCDKKNKGGQEQWHCYYKENAVVG